MVSCLGSLVQSAAGREGRCRQVSQARVPATLGLPRSQRVCSPRLHCSGSRLLYMEQALSCVQFQFSGPPQKRRLSWACVLCLPRPEQLRKPGAWWAHSPWVWCTFSPSWSQPQFPRTGLVHAPCVCSQELVSSRSPPSVCQPSRISGSLWLETGSLKLGACLQFGRGCRLWGRVCPFPLPPASCLWWWMGQSAAS